MALESEVANKSIKMSLGVFLWLFKATTVAGYNWKSFSPQPAAVPFCFDRNHICSALALYTSYDKQCH